MSNYQKLKEPVEILAGVQRIFRQNIRYREFPAEIMTGRTYVVFFKYIKILETAASQTRQLSQTCSGFH